MNKVHAFHKCNRSQTPKLIPDFIYIKFRKHVCLVTHDYVVKPNQFKKAISI